MQQRYKETTLQNHGSGINKVVAISIAYLSSFDINVQVQDSVSAACTNYFQKFRRSTHVTPKSFLSFINSYKEIYVRKEEDIGDLAARMNSGLSKLEEASHSVELLKEELNIMEQNLKVANKKAEDVLQEVTQRAKEAEKIKGSVTKVKDKAEKIVKHIG